MPPPIAMGDLVAQDIIIGQAAAVFLQLGVGHDPHLAAIAEVGRWRRAAEAAIVWTKLMGAKLAGFLDGNAADGELAVIGMQQWVVSWRRVKPELWRRRRLGARVQCRYHAQRNYAKH